VAFVFEAVWTFLGDEANQAVLSWLGGGMVVAAGGIWTVFKFLWKPQKTDDGKPDAVPGNGDILVEGSSNVVGGRVTIDNRSTTHTGLGRSGAIAIGLLCVGAVLLGAAFAGKSATADCGSVSVVGNVSGSTITGQNSGSGDCQ
jgi:hypothetical protein